MKAVAYALERAVSLSAATAALRAGGWGAKPIAGGQSLGPMLNLRLAQPETLIDLDGLAALREVTESHNEVSFGAMTTHAQVEDGRVPDPTRGLMPFVARGIAYRAVRNCGTIGGSLCHADPAADWVSALPLLGATLVIDGPEGRRELAAGEFMTSAFETRLGDGEILVAVRVPRQSSAARWSYRKFCRKTGEFAKAIAAALVDPDGGTSRVVLGALDGPPRIFAGGGLIHDLQGAEVRDSLVRQAGAGLEAGRLAILSEMLRLVANDMETGK